MWSAVASSIFLVTFADFVFSERNGSSLPVLNHRLSKFKTDVNRIFQGTRVKRQLEGSDPLIRKLKFGKVTQVDLPYLSDLSLSFWLSIESRNQVLIGTIEGNLLLFEMLDDGKNADFVAHAEYGKTPVKARAFSYYDEQWFVVLHNLGSKFRIQLYKRIGRTLKEDQSIDLNGVSDIELIEMKGIYYLVVSTYSTETNQGYSFQGSVRLYQWTQTQFDEIAWRVTYGARSLDCWTSDGSLYIAVGQETNDEGNLAVGSPVYIYNKEENKLVIWQMIATYGPNKVRLFYAAENRYLIFTGKQDAVIYWWSSGQFLEWQNLEGTADALDVSILSLGGEAALVVVLKEEALLYTLDTSGYYVISFSMSFKGSNLLSLQFMFSRNYYYALALFEEPQARSTWKLEISPHFLPSVDSLDVLQECLLETQQKVALRQTELDAVNSDIMRVWRRGSNQTLKTKVIVQGRIRSKESKVKDVIILKLLNIPHSSFSLVMVTLTDLMDSVEDTKREFDTVVLKSERQYIQGFKHFAEHVYVPSLRMESTDNDISINDVRVSRLKNYALRKVGNQVVPVPLVISNVFTETVKVDTVNGISTQDLLLLRGKQFVTGNLEFSGVTAGNMVVQTINSIPVEDIVITTSPQIIEDLKTFSRLASYSINVQGATNEVHLGSVYKKIATINSYNEFMGHITFQNTWTVGGNISLTSKLNKVVDISKLVSQSVNRDSQQDLTGFFTFNSRQTIDGDLFVTDSINGVSTDNLLTIESDQIVFADIVFDSSLSVARDAIVNAINNVDVGEQAVLKFPPHQFITGRKIFLLDISAKHVEMLEYVTLDHVDPSFLVQDLVQHRQGVVNSSSLVFIDVEVLGDVTVVNDLNDHTLDLFSSVWLKSFEQNISVPVTSNNFHLKHDLQVHTINNLDLENDFVSSYTSEVIESSKSFHSEIVLKSLTAENAKINGVYLKSLKIEIDRYMNEKNVKGIKTINKLEIFGKLHVKKLNDLEISEVMNLDDYQIVSGPVEFIGEITVILGNTESEAISFGLINSLELRDFFKKAVLLNDQSLLSKKHFGHLKATNLSVPFESRISGVNLQEMMQRVVIINVPQIVTAPKFFSEVNFSKITTTSLNDLHLTNYLNEVVFTDEVSKISHKQFAENVQASSVFVTGTINGINLEDMASNVFYKSEDNEVTGHFTFIGDVDVGHLSSSVIDGVKWNDLILIQSDQVLETAWFLSNIHAHEDAFITGLLNGCDLSLVSSSIYTNKTTQVISKRINVHTVLIIGNLEVKEKINEIRLDVLRNFITLSDDQVLASDVVIDDGLVVDNLILKNSEDSQNIEFIMTDAVRHSIPQEIQGYKEFENINVDAVNGGNLFVSRLDGIDLEEMKHTSVLKNGYQEIEGEKIFPTLFMNVAKISGYLNGLKLPRDVVTTDRSDSIASPVYFMSDVYIPDQIVVHGLTDGVDIDELIHHRFTLNSEQNITTQLILHDDIAVHGELTIEGTVNDIVLELVANVKSVNSLQGYKVFLDFYVSGSLSASSVNGYSVPQLDANILRRDKDDYVNEIQTFQKTIHAQNSIDAEWINGISVNWLKDAFAWMINNIKPTLEYLRSLSYNLQKQLTHQLSTTQGRESKFAYFTLHQEIDLGPTIRILRSHAVQDDGFSHSLVMWNKQKHCILMDMCCHLEFSYWLRVAKNGIVMVDEAAEPGKYYPILDPSQDILNKEFYVWTNSTYGEPKLCGNKSNKLFIADYSNNTMETFNLEDTPQLSDVKTFRKGHLYAVAAFYFDSKLDEYGRTIVYAYHETGKWYEHEDLPSYGVLSLDITTYNRDFREDVLLAVGTGMDTAPIPLSTIYKWNSSNRKFEIFQNIPSRYVASTLWINMGRNLLLSLANVEVWPVKEAECSELVSGGHINIYLYKEKLEWIQSIQVGGIISMVSFSVDGDTYLAAASSHQRTVYIFEWKGYSGFVQIQSISVEAQHLNVYEIDDDVYMTIASASSSSKVLKMVKKGKQSSKRYFEQMPLEQKDQVPQSSKVVTGC